MLSRLRPISQETCSRISLPAISPSSIRPTLQRQQNAQTLQIRTLVAAPKPGSGPLMERRADRELPSISTSSSKNVWLKTMPIFAVIVIGSALAIFNYQKTSSSVVSSTLYALRTNETAREVLGDEIYFASQIPWISGELNQLHGRIDISFWVKGTKGKGLMRFKSLRKTRMGFFETLEWSLQPVGQEKISLLENEGRDPFQQRVDDDVVIQ